MISWNGSISGIQKYVGGPGGDPSFDLEDSDDGYLDPEEQYGVCTIMLRGVPYLIEMTYQEFLDFEVSGFSKAHLMEVGILNPYGGWGWLNGRERLTGFAEKYN